MKHSLTVGTGVLLRGTVRERACQILHQVLQQKKCELEFENKIKLAYERIVWVQRNARFMIIFNSNKRWFGTVF